MQIKQYAAVQIERRRIVIIGFYSIENYYSFIEKYVDISVSALYSTCGKTINDLV